MITLADLQQRIAAVRRKERRVVLLSGLCRSAVALVGAVLAYFLVDPILMILDLMPAKKDPRRD